MRRLLKLVSVGLLLGCSVFFFAGAPGDLSTRSIQRAWDLGHVMFFLLASLVWLRWAGKPANRSAARDWIVLLAMVTVLGLVIEGVQALAGRDASVADVLRNDVGALLALAFGGAGGLSAHKRAVNGLRGAVIVLLILAVTPLIVALADEVSAAGAFPVLSDFETPFQLSRWESDEDISINRDTVREGHASMRVPLSTAQYSSVSLVYFPGDWSSAAALAASVFNPDSTPLELVIRVHDEFHDEHDQRYDDRFNAVFTISPGWNDLTIPIADIASGPRNRVMDLTKIEGLIFFTVRLPIQRTIFLDRVELR